TLPVGIESCDERADEDLAAKERSLEGHYDQVAPRFIGCVAYPHDRRGGLSIKSRRRADDEIIVRRPSEHITGIGRLERDRAGFEINPIHVEGVAVAQIERDEHEARMLQIGQNILRTNAPEWRQI